MLAAPVLIQLTATAPRKATENDPSPGAFPPNVGDTEKFLVPSPTQAVVDIWGVNQWTEDCPLGNFAFLPFK